LLLGGCSTAPASSCSPSTDKADSTLGDDYAMHRAASVESPAASRTPDDKGPSPEGVEAIALLGSQLIEARREACQKQGSSAPAGGSR